jgi:hypothetical protein
VKYDPKLHLKRGEGPVLREGGGGRNKIERKKSLHTKFSGVGSKKRAGNLLTCPNLFVSFFLGEN